MNVNKTHFPRRVLQYAAGLVVMAMGVVLMKRVDLGISPITAVPAGAPSAARRLSCRLVESTVRSTCTSPAQGCSASRARIAVWERFSGSDRSL